ncbi:hypothetical protein BC629DRAFT_1513551 [Irpex lacteus]|nr:hypothetical protein BC629DRAFT_1513551 [Irpex lacteus]
MCCFSMAKKITIRILWPGYCDSDLQISVRNDKRNAQPITKPKLAFNVCKVILRIIKELSHQSPIVSGQEQWVIPSDVSPKDVVLAQLRHVSRGSWQPVLYVVR